MRVFAAGLLTETNVFVNLPTSLKTFQDGHLPPGTCPADAPTTFAELMWVAKRRAAAGEFDLVEGSCFRAAPAGPTSREAYEYMCATICAQLTAAMPVDAILLGLHGGMWAYGYPDTEGDFIERIRAIAGPDAVIGVEFDPHCLITDRRLANSDVIVLYKEYPHTDIVEQAEAMIDIVLRTVRGEARPVASLFDCRQIDTYPTTAPAMRAFVDRLKAIEADDPAVLSISLVHGFCYNDAPDLGARILVYTNDDKGHGDALATELGEAFVAMRGRTASPLLGIDAAIDAALTAKSLVVIADPTDNAGGGAPGDNTDVLARLLARKVSNVAVGPLWDPVTARICFDAGPGAELPLRIGGKVAATSGAPVDCVAEVTGLKRDAWQMFGASRAPCGDSVALRIGGVEVVLTTVRTQSFSPELFTQVGIDLAARQAVFLKSVNHFMAGFGPIAGTVLHVDGGGPLRRDYATIPYRHVRRPIWPLDADVRPALIR